MKPAPSLPSWGTTRSSLDRMALDHGAKVVKAQPVVTWVLERLVSEIYSISESGRVADTGEIACLAEGAIWILHALDDSTHDARQAFVRSGHIGGKSEAVT